jgi:hypothetical protein
MFQRIPRALSHRALGGKTKLKFMNNGIELIDTDRYQEEVWDGIFLSGWVKWRAIDRWPRK